MNEYDVQDTLKEIHRIDRYQRKESILQRIHPSAKLIITILFLVALVSIHRYNLSGTLLMGVFLIVNYELGQIPVFETVLKYRRLFLMLLLLGIPNIFMDLQVMNEWGSIPITGGLLSFFTLCMKGMFAVLASGLLIHTTGIESICYALQVFHVPGTLVTVMLLIYRYIILFLKEVDRMTLSYKMRAPKQRGIHMRAWGSMVGAMLLRCVDKAELVYESMLLRGYSDRVTLRNRKRYDTAVTTGYLIGMGLCILILRAI